MYKIIWLSTFYTLHPIICLLEVTTLLLVIPDHPLWGTGDGGIICCTIPHHPDVITITFLILRGRAKELLCHLVHGCTSRDSPTISISVAITARLVFSLRTTLRSIFSSGKRSPHDMVSNLDRCFAAGRESAKSCIKIIPPSPFLSIATVA